MDLAALTRRRGPAVRTVAVRALIGLAAGAVLIVTFLRLVNVSAVAHRLTHLSVSYALWCGAVFLGAYIVRALRWRCLLRPCQVSIPRAVGIYQIATFLNWLLPVRGGELAKSVLLRHSNGIPISRSLATVTMDKAMDLLPAVILLASLPFVGLHLSAPLWVLLASALTCVGLAGGLLALAAWRRDRAQALLAATLTKVLPRRVSTVVEPFIMVFVDTLMALIRQPRLLLTAAAFTVVAISCDALFCLLAFRAVAVSVPVAVVLFGYTFFNLAFVLPTPPGQVGSNELIGLLIFSGMFGVGRSGVAAMFLFSHPWTAVLMTASGLVCLSAMGLTLRGAMHLASAEHVGPGEKGDESTPALQTGWQIERREELEEV